MPYPPPSFPPPPQDQAPPQPPPPQYQQGGVYTEPPQRIQPPPYPPYSDGQPANAPQPPTAVNPDPNPNPNPDDGRAHDVYTRFNGYEGEGSGLMPNGNGHGADMSAQEDRGERFTQPPWQTTSAGRNSLLLASPSTSMNAGKRDGGVVGFGTGSARNAA
jgi:hypothetical protein